MIDLFNDQGFFDFLKRDSACIASWEASINAALLADRKAAFLEFVRYVGRTFQSTPNVFANKKTENRMRALLIRSSQAYYYRRIAFALWCGDRDRYSTEFSMVQERLVEALRLDAEVIQCEVLFCVRVMLCRFSDLQLRSFWPIVQNELIGLLTNDSSSLVLKGAVCRLLDLATLFPFEAHKIQGTDTSLKPEWIYVTPEGMEGQGGPGFVPYLEQIFRPQIPVDYNPAAQLRPLLVPPVSNESLNTFVALLPMQQRINRGFDLKFTEQQIREEFCQGESQ